MKLLTKKEVANILRCSKKTVENYIKRGELEAKRIGGTEKKAGRVLVSKQALQNFINNS